MIINLLVEHDKTLLLDTKNQIRVLESKAKSTLPLVFSVFLFRSVILSVETTETSNGIPEWRHDGSVDLA